MNLEYPKKIRMEAKALELLEEALDRISVQNSKTNSTIISQLDTIKINRVREYILGHLDTTCTLKSLAREGGTNTFKLKKGFKLLYGITLFEFIREKRLHKAKTILANSHMQINKIAILVGYKNHANFTGAFKKRFGYPPNALRK